MSSNESVDLLAFEEQLNKKWLEDFEEYKKDLDAQVERYVYIKKICEKALIKANMVFENNEQLTEAMIVRAAQLICMGNDFEQLLTAIKADPTVNEAWENLLVTMRLCGLDQNQT